MYVCNVYTYVYMHVCMNVCMYVMNVFTYVCIMCVCIYVYMYVCVCMYVRSIVPYNVTVDSTLLVAYLVEALRYNLRGREFVGIFY